MKSVLLVGIVLGTLLATPAFAAPEFSFGDDSGDYSRDGECDDPRFVGSGMTTTALLSADVLRDATDCKTAYDAGTITLRGIADDGKVDFGDDKGEYAKDGECDDLRFKGPGMTGTALIADDIMHDASDCRTAYKAGRLELNLQ